MPSLPGSPSRHATSCRLARPRPWKAGQDIHQIHVPPMKAAQVVAVAEARIAVAGLPIARCGDAVQEAAVMQHRQVEARTVPRHQFGGVAVQAVEKAFDQILFRGALLAQAPYLERIARAHDHGNRDDPMLFVRQEFTSGFLAALGEHDLRHLFIGQLLEPVQAPAELGVGHGLDVEHQRRCERAGAARRCAAFTPHISGEPRGRGASAPRPPPPGPPRR